MQPTHVATEALRTLWKHKVLWLFGFFVAAGGGGGSGAPGRGPHPAAAGSALPAWVYAAIAAGAVLALILLLAHVLSEGALIVAARASREGTPVGVRTQLRAGWSAFGRVFVLKVMIIAAMGATLGVAGGPAVLGALGLIPLW